MIKFDKSKKLDHLIFYSEVSDFDRFSKESKIGARFKASLDMESD
jgi:hypothetical protein